MFENAPGIQQTESGVSPGWGKTWAATARLNTLPGSLVTNRVSRMMSGLSPFYSKERFGGSAYFPQELEDPKFWEKRPYAAAAADILYSTKSDDDFWHTVMVLDQQAEDFETLANSGFATSMAMTLFANVADPTNFIPMGAYLSVARGVKTASLLRNMFRGGMIAATLNTIQEEGLHALSPGRPIGRIEADLMAAGMGFAFGGALGFLAAPNFRPSSRGFRKWTGKIPLGDMRKNINRAFSDNVEGKPIRDFSEHMEDGTRYLQSRLDDSKPKMDGSAEVLVTRTGTDANSKLLPQVIKKYNDAGFQFHLREHPLQQDFNILSDAHQNLSKLSQDLRKIENDPAARKIMVARAGDLAESAADAIAMTGTTALGKVMSYVTPAGYIQRSGLGAAHAAWRIAVFEGTVTKGAAEGKGHVGTASAEALKENMLAPMYQTFQDMRQAYAPDKDVPVTKPGKKVAAIKAREPIKGKDAKGADYEIPAYGAYNAFTRRVIQTLMERQAAHELGVDISKAVVPPQVETAIKSMRKFFGSDTNGMLDLADYVGLLPGKRALKRHRENFDDRLARTHELEEELRAAEAEAETPLLEGEARTAPAEAARYSNVPESHDHTVVRDYGGYLANESGRKWDLHWLTGMTSIAVGADPALIAKIRMLSGEIWDVRQLTANGKHWRTARWLVPEELVEKARQTVSVPDDVRLRNKLARSYADLDRAAERLLATEHFNENAEFYFNRRWLSRAVEKDPDGFKAAILRGWEQARRRGFDEHGERITFGDDQVPLVNEVRDTLKIGEEFRTETDYAQGATPEQWAQYVNERDMYFDRVADSVYNKIAKTDDNLHGVEHAFATGSPFMTRTLQIDGSDPAIQKFLNLDGEQLMAAYAQTAGGRIALMRAIQMGKHMFGPDGAHIETPEEMLAFVMRRFNESHEVAAGVDAALGVNKHAAKIAADRDRVELRLKRRLKQLLGYGIKDNSEGANAVAHWAGRQGMTLVYNANLGSQVLAAINDVSAVSLFTSVVTAPRNIKYLVKAVGGLKEFPKRALKLFHLGFESQQQRAKALWDVDFNIGDEHFPGGAVGTGPKTRAFTSTIGVGMEKMTRFFNEFTLINTWNRYIKSATAMIAMDDVSRYARWMGKVDALTAGGMELDAAIRKAGFPSKWDYAHMLEMGFDSGRSRQLADLLFKYGTDENGRTFAELGISKDDMLNYKGIILPDADRWVEMEGDVARDVRDLYVAGVNSMVERGMVLTPGMADKPLMNDHFMGRAFNMFQTFNYAWANQVLRPLAQRPAGKQVAGLSTYFMIGVLVDAIRNQVTGRRNIDETTQLWQDNPLSMTYAITHTSGISGWLNRPMAIADKLGVGPGSAIGATISRSAWRARTLGGSASPLIDYMERIWYGGTGGMGEGEFSLAHAHALRKTVPFQNAIAFRLLNTFFGFDPYFTEQMNLEKFGRRDPQP